MITEDYVSFETAKLLKEKGFDEPCDFYINEHFPTVLTKYSDYGIKYKNSDKESVYSAPTIQMAMKWLREKHKLHIITLPYAPFDRHSYHPGFEAEMVYIAQLFRGIIPIDGIGRSVIKLTNEEACEAGLKYCLENLI